MKLDNTNSSSSNISMLGIPLPGMNQYEMLIKLFCAL